MRDYDELSPIIAEIFENMQKEIYAANASMDEEKLDEVLKRWHYNSSVGNYIEAKRPRVLIVGECKIVVFNETIGELGFTPDQFDFIPHYDNRFDFSSLRFSDKYSDVLLGAMDHKKVGIGDNNSALSMFENHPDEYPNAIACRTKTGELKITKESLRNALMQTQAYAYMVSSGVYNYK